MKDPEQFLASIGSTDCLENFQIGWEESLANLPSGIPFFFEDEYLRETLDFLDLGEEGTALYREIAPMVAQARQDPDICLLAWHFYWRLFHRAQPIVAFKQWPEPERLGPAAQGVPYLAACLGGIREYRKYHQSLGIPKEVSSATCGRVVHMCNNNYRKMYGRPGVYYNQMSWLRHYAQEPIFRLGRIEYWLKQNQSHPFTIYRNIHDRRIVAFPEPGIRHDEHGWSYDESIPNAYQNGSWLSELEVKDGFITGTPIDPRGFVRREKVRLPLAEWELFLTKGSWILENHIPSGGNMTLELLRQSYEMAREFFPKYFPEMQPRATLCASWIMNPQLQRILPETANLVRFQRELFLLPRTCSGPGGLWFIFLQEPPYDPEKLPRDTSLQRAVADFLKTGEPWRVGDSILLLDDIPNFGTQQYQQ
ncbi:MAG: DUF5596 domain-containing protein [Victivallales bacterium]|nr:DUF5596 domain-containing protein [Victivallales bacterium]